MGPPFFVFTGGRRTTASSCHSSRPARTATDSSHQTCGDTPTATSPTPITCLRRSRRTCSSSRTSREPAVFTFSATTWAARPRSPSPTWPANVRLSLATIETPFFGLDYPGYNDPRVAYWHLGMHANMDIARFLIEGREEQYLRHFFRDFAYNPSAIPEEDRK